MKSYPHLREMSDTGLREIVRKNRDKVSVAERSYAYAAQVELDRREKEGDES